MCFLCRNIVIEAVSYFPSTPWTPRGMVQKPVRVVKKLWCSYRFKDPSDIILFWRPPHKFAKPQSMNLQKVNDKYIVTKQQAKPMGNLCSIPSTGRYSLFSTSRPTLRPNKPPVQCTPGAYSLIGKAAGVLCRPLRVQSIKMCEAIPLPPHCVVIN